MPEARPDVEEATDPLTDRAAPTDMPEEAKDRGEATDPITDRAVSTDMPEEAKDREEARTAAPVVDFTEVLNSLREDFADEKSLTQSQGSFADENRLTLSQGSLEWTPMPWPEFTKVSFKKAAQNPQHLCTPLWEHYVDKNYEEYANIKTTSGEEDQYWSTWKDVYKAQDEKQQQVWPHVFTDVFTASQW
jgi:hypothetical protein